MPAHSEDLAQALQINQLSVVERSASTAIAASVLAREALERTVERQNELLQEHVGEPLLTWANEVYVERKPDAGIDSKETYLQEVRGKFAGICVMDGSSELPEDGSKKLVEIGLADRLLRVGLVVHPETDVENWAVKRVPISALEEPIQAP
ncbi:MAG TPA: hypothetical protein VD706_03045 [Candidatus Saccharimonadales bacterium]|nr:hypothetical protein [Candidatus Saccharimonadales bacterium]